MIPPIKLRLQRVPLPNEPRKVHRVIKLPRGHDPLIDPLPGRLASRPAVRLTLARKRGDGSADGHVTLGLGVGDDLLVGRDKAVGELRGAALILGSVADVVDTLEDHDVLDAGLVDGVALVSREESGAEAAREDGVASCCLIADCDVGDAFFLHAVEEQVGPAGVRGECVLVS